jgi:hypothetical protein
MPDGLRARTAARADRELRSAGRPFLGESREVLELLPVGPVDERTEDRTDQCVEPVGRVETVSGGSERSAQRPVWIDIFFEPYLPHGEFLECSPSR